MKLWLIGALMVAMLATAPATTEAKRLAGGKPAGMQRNMPARTAPDAPPAKPAPAQQATPATPAPAPAAAPAVPPKRSWLGPLAGLAAGLGLGALLSHFGMGQGLASGLMFALLAAAVVLGVMFLWRRFGAATSAGTPMLAGAGAGGSQPAWPQAATTERRTLNAATAAGSAPALPGPPPVQGVFVPASFDSEAFARTAKMIFIRLQTAHDSADLDDLRRFTTPELFASIRIDILERGTQPQQTDVVEVEAEVLDVADEAAQQVVSVRFHGRVVEEKGAAPTAFNEVWHLVKPLDDSRPWVIAGIEQLA